MGFRGFCGSVTMAGIALVLDLLRKNPSLTTQSLHASGFFSAKAAASAAAASVAAGAPYVYKSFRYSICFPIIWSTVLDLI